MLMKKPTDLSAPVEITNLFGALFLVFSCLRSRTTTIQEEQRLKSSYGVLEEKNG